MLHTVCCILEATPRQVRRRTVPSGRHRTVPGSCPPWPLRLLPNRRPSCHSAWRKYGSLWRQVKPQVRQSRNGRSGVGSRYPRAQPVALAQHELRSPPCGRPEHSPTGKARGTLPFGLIGNAASGPTSRLRPRQSRRAGTELESPGGHGSQNRPFQISD